MASLSVFFIQDIGYMIFSISFSMVSYFFLSVILKKYLFQLEHINFIAYLINQALAIVYIFYGLYLIKTENANYNRALHHTNVEIQKQSNQLKEQANELDQLNTLKNKLFSVISHDLKAPMYALRNLFENMHSQDMPADDIKSMVPRDQAGPQLYREPWWRICWAGPKARCNHMQWKRMPSMCASLSMMLWTYYIDRPRLRISV